MLWNLTWASISQAHTSYDPLIFKKKNTQSLQFQIMCRIFLQKVTTGNISVSGLWSGTIFRAPAASFRLSTHQKVINRHINLSQDYILKTLNIRTLTGFISLPLWGVTGVPVSPASLGSRQTNKLRGSFSLLPALRLLGSSPGQLSHLCLYHPHQPYSQQYWASITNTELKLNKNKC